MSILFPTPLPAVSVRRPFVRTLLVAIVVTAGFMACWSLLQDYAPIRFSYLLLLLPIAFSAWYGGARPTSIAALAGLIVADYWLISPGSLWPRGATMWAEAAVYAVGVAAIIFFASSFRRELRKIAAELTVTEQEVQRARLDEMTLRASVRRLEDESRRNAQELARMGGRLRTSEDRLRVAQESAGFCLFDWGHPGDDIFVFGDPLPLFGVAASDWKGKESLLASVHEDDRELLASALEATLTVRRPLDIEVRLTEEEHGRWVAIRGKTSYNKTGEPARTIGIFLDITEKKLTEQILLRTEKLAAAGRLAAAIAHEVNNPLAAATNLMFIIKGDGTLSRSGKQYVEMAEQELARLGRIAKQTLGFYRESSLPCKTDLAAVLDGVLEMYARNLPAGIKLHKRYGQGPQAEVVEGEIRQVFANVLVNAVQAMGDSGALTVRVEPVARPDGKGWLVSVRDNGPGIAADDLCSLFEPFFTRKGGGTGLGLWIAKQIVERHGGVIRVDSVTSGEEHGTTVSIYLPCEQRRLHKAAEESVA
ncbi:MAG TPA: ATP-binding protein [Terriglobales bacterium]|nr:ATP-binding protein [Terriglobales bacterium]